MAFVVLFGVAATLYASGAGSSQPDVSAYYSDPGQWSQQIEGFGVLTVASIALMIFVVTLCHTLIRQVWWRDVALLSGTAGVVFLMLANMLWSATAFTVLIQHHYQVLATTHLLVEDAAFVGLVVAMAAAIPWVLIVSWSGARQGVVPIWFGALGGAASALGQALSYWYFPLAIFLLWVVVASLLLAVRWRALSEPQPEPLAEVRNRPRVEL
ncbi:MAG TPA: hypothetical protein VGX27_15215 [Candidatus Dormibacteraeota bacterium]|nr:hypothetical protein [Candidatus Dormibacteraeota bacterium]